MLCRIPWLSYYGSSILVRRKVGVAFYFRETEHTLISRHFKKLTGRGCCKGGDCRVSAGRKGLNTQPSRQGEGRTLPGTSNPVGFIQPSKPLNSRGKELPCEDTGDRVDWLSQRQSLPADHKASLFQELFNFGLLCSNKTCLQRLEIRVGGILISKKCGADAP